MSLYDDFLYLHDIAPGAKATDRLTSEDAARGYGQLIKVLADFETKEKKRMATAEAARLKGFVALAAANKALIRGLEQAQATTVASSNAAVVANAGTARAAANALLAMPNAGQIHRAHEAGLAAMTAAGVSGYDAKAAYIKSIVGALDQPAEVAPGAFTGANIAMDLIKEHTGIEVGSAEFNEALKGSPSLKRSALHYKQVGDAERLARGSIEESLVKHDDVVSKIQRGLSIGELVADAQQAATLAEAGAVGLAGAPLDVAERQYSSAVESLQTHQEMEDTAAKLKEIMFGGGSERDTTIKEQVAKTIMGPNFQYWRKQHGFADSGHATFNEDGSLKTYTPGRTDAHAVLLWNWQLRNPDGEGAFGRGRPLFNKSTGQYLRVPVQTVSVEDLRIREGADVGKFATITDPRTGEVRYMSPGDIDGYRLDAGLSPPEVEMVQYGAGDAARLLVRAGDRYFAMNDSGMLMPVDAPEGEPVSAAPALLLGGDGTPARFARADDLDGPMPASALGTGDAAGVAAVRQKLPEPVITDTAPPPGGMWVAGKERMLVASDFRYAKRDATGKVIALPVRVIGRMGDAKPDGERFAEFLISPDGEVIESAPVPDVAKPGEETSRVVKGSLREWFEMLKAKREARIEALDHARRGDATATVVEGAVAPGAKPVASPAPGTAAPGPSAGAGPAAPGASAGTEPVEPVYDKGVYDRLLREEDERERASGAYDKDAYDRLLKASVEEERASKADTLRSDRMRADAGEWKADAETKELVSKFDEEKAKLDEDADAPREPAAPPAEKEPPADAAASRRERARGSGRLVSLFGKRKEKPSEEKPSEEKPGDADLGDGAKAAPAPEEKARREAEWLARGRKWGAARQEDRESATAMRADETREDRETAEYIRKLDEEKAKLDEVPAASVGRPVDVDEMRRAGFTEEEIAAMVAGAASRPPPDTRATVPSASPKEKSVAAPEPPTKKRPLADLFGKPSKSADWAIGKANDQRAADDLRGIEWPKHGRRDHPALGDLYAERVQRRGIERAARGLLGEKPLLGPGGGTPARSIAPGRSGLTRADEVAQQRIEEERRRTLAESTEP